MSAAAASAGAVGAVRAAVRGALAGDAGPLVLAVSGGRDSVVLLDAVLAVAPDRVAGVATFDHGTGPLATAAADHAADLARSAGLRVWRDRAPDGTPPTEAAWRRARWAFLRVAARSVEGDLAARVVTGHSRDDQAETVLLRTLRGAGARGLAGMAAAAPGIVRPLLTVGRAEIARYAAERGLRWVEDPGNASAAHRRNRLRHAVLPAAERALPGFADALFALGRAAASWRAEVDAAADAAADPMCADGILGSRGTDRAGAGELAVPLATLAGHDEAALRVLWPALAARVGAALDRRGTARLAAFTARCLAARAADRIPAGAVPLAGRLTVAVERQEPASPERAMVLRRGARRACSQPEPLAPVALGADTLAGGVRFGRWRFAAAAAGAQAPELPDGPWRVRLPRASRYVVRAWRPGDRMPFRADGAARRVKRFLADRRVPAAERAAWPVVVAEPSGAIVWIPGVRRSPAAPARPGEPGLDLICERLPDRPAQ